MARGKLTAVGLAIAMWLPLAAVAEGAHASTGGDPFFALRLGGAERPLASPVLTLEPDGIPVRVGGATTVATFEVPPAFARVVLTSAESWAGATWRTGFNLVVVTPSGGSYPLEAFKDSASMDVCEALPARCSHALVTTPEIPAAPGVWSIAYWGQSTSVYDVTAYGRA